MYCRLIIWFELLLLYNCCVESYHGSEFDVAGGQQALHLQSSVTWDRHGYVMFCLCMGKLSLWEAFSCVSC